MTSAAVLAAAAVVAIASACQPRAGDEGADRPTAGLGDASDTATGGPVRRSTLDSLEAEIRRLANADGCATAAQCRTAPFGAKPCGGPWRHVVYCSLTTDTLLLFRTLDRHRQLERRYNEQEGAISDCMLVTPPELRVMGNTCMAVGAEVR